MPFLLNLGFCVCYDSHVTTRETYLERIDHARNMARYYRLSVVKTLFGEWAMVREWGRIGRRGLDGPVTRPHVRACAGAMTTYLIDYLLSRQKVTVPMSRAQRNIIHIGKRAIAGGMMPENVTCFFSRGITKSGCGCQQSSFDSENSGNCCFKYRS